MREQLYALKEFKNRWYVVARDAGDGLVKSFALDRLSDLEITGKSFLYPKEFDVEEEYRHFFGIIIPLGQQPEEVVLSFDPVQGKYIKSLPLHQSQKVLNDNDKELRVRLYLCITYDFIQELLSHGESMRVIEPESLANSMKKTYQRALDRYAEPNE